jgi:hypothetical protein
MTEIQNFPELSAPERELLLSLAAGDEIYAYSITPDRGSVQLRLFVDGAPYLHTYERHAVTGEYQLVGVAALGQLKF